LEGKALDRCIGIEVIGTQAAESVPRGLRAQERLYCCGCATLPINYEPALELQGKFPRSIVAPG